MKELIVRSVSGLLYILAIIVSLLVSKEWFYLLFFVLGIFTIKEFKKIISLKSIFPYLLFFLLYAIFTYKTNNQKAAYIYAIIACTINVILLVKLFNPKTIKYTFLKKHLLLLFYIISGFIFIALIPNTLKEEGNKVLISVFILIWANDSFAYLVGKSLGKHKLFERISPKKTIEGFIGGLAGTIIVALFIFNYIELFSLNVWVYLALIISALGTIGDLIQSKFKRQAGVKDSGAIMPGHGGIYDRLDSILYSSPFIYIFLKITTAYVS